MPARSSSRLAPDEKLRRLIELTCFGAALRQEAAADELGLACRRHLATAFGRLAAWLAKLEQGTRG